jgi:hypothetical protein
MTNQNSINTFKSYASSIETINVESVVRSNLGPLAFPEAANVLGDLRRKISIANIAPEAVPQQSLDVLNSSLSQVIQLFQRIGNLSDAAFAQERSDFPRQLEGPLDAIAQYWAPFIATAIERTGVLEGAGLIKQQLSEEATRLLGNISQQAEQYLSMARAEAAKIKDRANLTAAGISVKAAQDQFDSAQKSLYRQAFIWSALGTLAFAGFFLFALYLLKNPPTFDAKITTQILVAEAAYKTAIRITILTAIGAVTTFFLRMARAHFHMAAYNEHRRRVANSMSAFVEAASAPEQRDLILGRLVEAVVQFGDSGILEGGKDAAVGPTVSIDAIMKSLPKSGG